MGMTNMTIKGILAGLAGVVAFGTAAAQTANALPGKKAAFESLSAGEVAEMLAEFDMTTELRGSQTPGRSPAVVATLNTGAKFLIGFFNCDDMANAVGCKQVMISTAQPVAGAAFEDLNSFNGVSNVTTVVYESGNQLLLFGRNVFVPGGIGRDNFKLQVALFLNDMQTFVNSRQGSAASVSFNKKPSLKSKIASFTAGDGSPWSERLLVSDDAAAEVEIAINNSIDKGWAVDFDLLAE